MAAVTVTLQSADTYAVEVSEFGGTSSHTVTATPAHLAGLGLDAPPERVIEESFYFLLEREPKEAILARFELPVIGRYFPEYPAEIRHRLES
jgi:tRNA nucleotidyltransferase/poly(A) polymerase